MENMERQLSAEKQEELLAGLENRFKKNIHLHEGMEWPKIRAKLELHPEKLWSLYEMEKSGGEPDIIGYDQSADVYTFCDCAAESPSGRRSLCYDRAALESRKENKPLNSALDLASAMGIQILTEEQYRGLQELGKFDMKTSSWVRTPDNIRKQGGAIFCDRRYDTVFVYHNGAESYYSSRGFRGVLHV